MVLPCLTPVGTCIAIKPFLALLPFLAIQPVLGITAFFGNTASSWHYSLFWHYSLSWHCILLWHGIHAWQYSHLPNDNSVQPSIYLLPTTQQYTAMLIILYFFQFPWHYIFAPSSCGNVCFHSSMQWHYYSTFQLFPPMQPLPCTIANQSFFWKV